jgi:MFS family permease
VSWRWCWWINLPIAGVTIILLQLFLDVHNPKTSLIDGVRAIDWLGSISIIGLTLMVLLGLDFGGVTFSWNSPKVICLIIFGAAMSVFFIFSEKRLAKYPLIPLDLFYTRSNIASLVVTFVHGFVSTALYACHSTNNLQGLHKWRVLSSAIFPISQRSLSITIRRSHLTDRHHNSIDWRCNGSLHSPDWSVS